MSNVLEKDRKNLIINALLDIGQSLQNVTHIIEATNDLAVDHLLRRTHDHLIACQRFIHLYRPPVMQKYDPAQLLRDVAAQETCSGDGGAWDYQVVSGDREQIRECLRLMIDNIELGPKGSMYFTYVADGNNSHYAMGFPASGTFREIFKVGTYFSLPPADVGERWTSATAGGPAVWLENGVELYLAGDRPVPSSSDALGRVLAPVTEAVDKLRPWQGAIGVYEEGFGEFDETKALYLDTLAKVQSNVQAALNKLV